MTDTKHRHGDEVRTFADGFGLWHAVVTNDTHGYAPHYAGGEWDLLWHQDRLRIIARKYIRAELEARGVPRQYRLNMGPALFTTDDAGVVRIIEFVELASMRDGGRR
jgi:hypothetical protein